MPEYGYEFVEDRYGNGYGDGSGYGDGNGGGGVDGCGDGDGIEMNQEIIIS